LGELFGAAGSTHGLPAGTFAALGRLLQTLNLGETRVIPMPGGASTRQYFRIRGSVGQHDSVVVMYVPDGPTPEEIDKAGVGARWPFLEVRDLLAERAVQVPLILAEDTPNGLLVIEDLHDNTLAEGATPTGGAAFELSGRQASVRRRLALLGD
jgi:N-acetylmuramate 1-kinase